MMTNEQAAVEIARHGSYTKITIAGKLVYGSTNSVKEELSQAVAEGARYVMDLSHLQFIDSVGFGVLINFAKKVGSANMALAVRDPLVKELFTISKLHLLFPIMDTVEAAAKALQENQTQKMQIEEY